MSRFDLFFVVLDECDENTDYNIAQHIVGFHRGLHVQDEHAQVSQTDLACWIKYARSLTPILTKEACEYLTSRYIHFRQQDGAGIDKTSYRITVRQLESMIRLSEAIAKLSLATAVTVDHVVQASKLLRTSIVTIDQDRVDFEDDVQQEVQEEMQEDHVQPVPSTKISLDAQEYARMVKQIAQKVHSLEEGSDSKGVRKSVLLDWWCEEHEDELNTQQDLERQVKLFSLVVKRMVKRVCLDFSSRIVY